MTGTPFSAHFVSNFLKDYDQDADNPWMKRTRAKILEILHQPFPCSRKDHHFLDVRQDPFREASGNPCICSFIVIFPWARAAEAAAPVSVN